MIFGNISDLVVLTIFIGNELFSTYIFAVALYSNFVHPVLLQHCLSFLTDNTIEHVSTNPSPLIDLHPGTALDSVEGLVPGPLNFM